RFERAAATAEPRVDLACTVRTLVARRACLLEGRVDAPPGADDDGRVSPRPRSREREAARLVAELCAALVATPRAEACRAAASAQVEVCAAPSAAPLVDAGGRFLAASAACYDALGDAADAVRALTEGHQTCCACLTEDEASE